MIFLLWMACVGSTQKVKPALKGERSLQTLNLARLPERMTALTVPASSCAKSCGPVQRGERHTTVRLKPIRSGAKDSSVDEFVAHQFFVRIAMERYEITSPPGMVVRVGGRRLKGAAASDPWTWQVKNRALIVRVPVGTTAEEAEVTFGEVGVDQQNLDRRTATAASDREFVFRDQSLYRSERGFGLYLPAPASITYELTLPTGSIVFDSMADLLAPAVQLGRGSTGAVIELQINDEVVLRAPIKGNGHEHLRVDLSAWAGKKVKLTLRTDPGEDAEFDYVFLREPTIYRPTNTPRRVLVVMVDTLRADHLGTYGYARDTSPNIDAWAKNARVFEHGYSPAPWTLPSNQALLSGGHPELWSEKKLLGSVFAEAGFASVSLVTNIYLTEKFGLHTGWTKFENYRGQRADVGERRLERVLKEFEDRDLVVFFHLMDPHAPYVERKRYRKFDKGSPLADSGLFKERELEDAYTTRDPAQVRDYTVARYDNNILAVDDTFGRVVRRFGPNTTVVLTADHGEGLFEDGYLAHGFGLSPGELGIPIIIGGPGIAPGRSVTEATLMDLLPTLAELHGVAVANTDGRSLVPSLHGKEQTRTPIGVGRNMFYELGWGAIFDDQIYVTRGSTETVTQFSTGQTIQAAFGPWRDRAAAGLGRPMVQVSQLCFEPHKGTHIVDKTVKITVEGEHERAWFRSDGKGTLSSLQISSTKVEAKHHHNRAAPREFFIEGLTDATVTYRSADGTWTGPFIPGARMGPDGKKLRLGIGWQPLPWGPPEERQLDIDTQSELKALGYIE